MSADVPALDPVNICVIFVDDMIGSLCSADGISVVGPNVIEDHIDIRTSAFWVEECKSE